MLYGILNKETNELLTFSAYDFDGDSFGTYEHEIDTDTFESKNGHNFAGLIAHDKYERMVDILVDLLLNYTGDFEVVELKWERF